jgi:hypothetical protein
MASAVAKLYPPDPFTRELFFISFSNVIPLKSLLKIAEEVVLFMKELLLPAAAIGKVATDFNGADSTTGGGGVGGGFVEGPPSPEFFLQEDSVANNSINPQ